MPSRKRRRDQPSTNGIDVGAYVVDPTSAKIAWASRETSSWGADRLATTIAVDLDAGLPVTLGIVMPTWIPVTRKATNLYGTRAIEPVALVDLVWLLSRLKDHAPALRAFVRWKPFVEATGPTLFVWEAFRNGSSNTDLGTLLAAFAHATTASKHDAVVATGEVLSIVGAALVRVGLTEDLEVVKTPLILVCSPPASVEEDTAAARRERDEVFIDYLVRCALKAWFLEHDMPLRARFVEDQIRESIAPKEKISTKKARGRPRA